MAGAWVRSSYAVVVGVSVGEIAVVVGVSVGEIAVVPGAWVRSSSEHAVVAAGLVEERGNRRVRSKRERTRE